MEQWFTWPKLRSAVVLVLPGTSHMQGALELLPQPRPLGHPSFLIYCQPCCYEMGTSLCLMSHGLWEQLRTSIISWSFIVLPVGSSLQPMLPLSNWLQCAGFSMVKTWEPPSYHAVGLELQAARAKNKAQLEWIHQDPTLCTAWWSGETFIEENLFKKGWQRLYVAVAK